MGYAKPVHVAGNLPSGRVFGYDDEGGEYVGAVRQVGTDELTVDTTVAADGLSYERTVSYDGQIVGRSTVTRAGFVENALMTGAVVAYDEATGKATVDVPDGFTETVEEAWQADLKVTKLPPSAVHTETVIDWTEV